MTSRESHHPYRNGVGGRHFQSFPDGRQIASLSCGCGSVEEIGGKRVLPADQYDKKFRQRGWRLDPVACPACQRTPKEKDMTTETIIKAGSPVSAPTMKAQRRLTELLTEHFDEENGIYGKGWSDQRVADESGLSLAYVTRFRDEAFGKLKTPPEVVEAEAALEALRVAFARDLKSVEDLYMGEITKMQAKVAQIRERFAS